MHFAWVPVCLGVGIGIYFQQAREPEVLTLAGIAAFAVACALAAGKVGPVVAPFLLAAAPVCTVFGLAKWRTEAVATPQLTFRYYGPIEGRVVGIDRSASDAVRLTLDRVVLARMSPDRTPARVRISLHGEQPLGRIGPGDTLILTGHLAPPRWPRRAGRL